MFDPDMTGAALDTPRVVSVAALNTLLDILTAPPVPFPGESPTKRMEVLNMHTGRCQVAQSIRELIVMSALVDKAYFDGRTHVHVPKEGDE